jgi:hypothetical protein
LGPVNAVYPDLVLLSLERGRRLQGSSGVETGESVNHLEALAQWTHLAKLRAEFHPLYVPAGMVEVARRLCRDNQIVVAGSGAIRASAIRFDSRWSTESRGGAKRSSRGCGSSLRRCAAKSPRGRLRRRASTEAEGEDQEARAPERRK